MTGESGGTDGVIMMTEMLEMIETTATGIVGGQDNGHDLPIAKATVMKIDDAPVHHGEVMIKTVTTTADVPAHRAGGMSATVETTIDAATAVHHVGHLTTVDTTRMETGHALLTIHHLNPNLRQKRTRLSVSQRCKQMHHRLKLSVLNVSASKTQKMPRKKRDSRSPWMGASGLSQVFVVKPRIWNWEM